MELGWLKSVPINRRDLSLVTFILTLTQASSSFHSSDVTSKEIANFKDEFRQSLLEREMFFVRKADVQSMNSKLDLLDEKVSKIQEDLKRDYSELDADLGTIGCALSDATDVASQN